METGCRAGGQPSEHAARVLEQVVLAPGCFLLTVAAPGLARAASPGQFALLGCGTGYDPFLRRPLSIHQVAGDRGAVSFLYQVKGAGTQWLAERRRGDVIPVLGPLGRGFRRSGSGKRGLLVGAGLGVAPLLFLAEELAGQEWSLAILLGARTGAGILRPDAFERFGTVKTITEDGSTPKKGTILDLLQEEIKKGGWDTIYACGPRVVLKAIQGISERTGIPAQISVEERMACGLGACLGCVCRSAHSSGFLRVCKEGPVFDAGEVLLDD